MVEPEDPSRPGLNEGGRSGRDTGAYSISEREKRRGLAWLWWLLLALLILAALIGLGFALGWFDDDDDSGSSGPPTTLQSELSSDSTAAAPEEPGNTSTSSRAESPTSSSAGQPPPTVDPQGGTNGLVGGGSVAPTAAGDEFATSGLVGTVLFDEAGANLDPSAAAVIVDAAARIDREGASTVTVTGYTDGIGDPSVNQPLSVARAQAVINALRPQVAETVSFDAAAFGQAQPVGSNETPAGRQLNRRVTITTR